MTTTLSTAAPTTTRRARASRPITPYMSAQEPGFTDFLKQAFGAVETETHEDAARRAPRAAQSATRC